MPTFLLSVITPTDGVPPAPDELGAITTRVEAVRADHESAGGWIFSGGLDSPAAALRAVRQTTGEVLVVDGPFGEAREHVGGLTLFTAADADEAAAWAQRYAAAIGLPIELRAFV